MKFLATAYIVIFYSSAIFKPVLPYVADFLSHLLAHEHHIATVHSHHGHDHAHQEAADAADEDENQDQAKFKYSEPVPVHPVTKNSFNWEVPVPAITYNVPPGYSTNKPLLPVNIPPPKMA